jgi:hypothetical protein
MRLLPDAAKPFDRQGPLIKQKSISPPHQRMPMSLLGKRPAAETIAAHMSQILDDNARGKPRIGLVESHGAKSAFSKI